MYEVVTYFHGPATSFGGKVDEREVLARHPSPWLWLARARASGILKDLNLSRCGVFISRNGELVEHHESQGVRA